MITISDVVRSTNKHSNREGELPRTLVCVEDDRGQIVYVKTVRVEPHPQTGEVVVVLDVKG